MIHVIGDSHSCIFSGQEGYAIWDDAERATRDILPNFHSYRIGPATAYQFDRKLGLVKNILGQFADVHDTVIPCCGEVDCRAHLIKQSQTSERPIKDVVDECVIKYFQTILELRDWAKGRNFKIAVWGPIASFPDTIKYDGPFQGTCLERNHVTRLFTNLLRALCEATEIPFGSIFEAMLLPDGTTNPSYITDSIHSHTSTIPLILAEAKRIKLIKE